MGIINTIRTVAIKDLKPYENNAKRHTGEQLQKLSKSIEEYGFISPVIIDKDCNIIAGHGRTEAAKSLGMNSVPCVLVDGLTEEQRKAYIIADNRLAEFGVWDEDLLRNELATLELNDVDISQFDFKLPEEELSDGGYYGDERERTFDTYNLGIANRTEKTGDFWQMPEIKNDDIIPSRLIGFNYAKSSKDTATGIHFFIDDYQFERLWNNPEKYTDVLKPYECILTPDFSLYLEMPMPMKIWNVYRSRQIGAFYQSKGIKVIPTISWAERDTFEFCFRGIAEGSTVAISTIGVRDDENALKIWHEGVDAMIENIRPSNIIVYGSDLEHDYKGINIVKFSNEVTKKWKKSK